MLRPDDPYNQGIGTPYLGDMNLGQVPVNNMQVAEAINYGVLPGATELFEGSYPFGYSKSSNYGGNTYTGTTKEDFYNALEAGTFGMKTEDIYNKNINDLFKGVADDEIGTGMFFDAKPTWERTGTGTDYKGTINVPKKDLGKIPVPKGFWKDDDQASLDDDADFYNEYGYPKTAMIGLPQLFGMITKGGITKKAIQKAIIQNQISGQIGKRVRPHLVKTLRQKLLGEKFGGSGKFKNIATGTKDYGPHKKSTPALKKKYTSPARPHGGGGARPDKPGGFTDPGKGSYGPHMAYGGRVSYFDGGLASLWPR